MLPIPYTWKHLQGYTSFPQLIQGEQATLPIFCARAGWCHHRGPKGGFRSCCNPKSVPDVVVQVTFSSWETLEASSEADTEVVQPPAGGQAKSIPAVTAQPPGPLRYRQSCGENSLPQNTCGGFCCRKPCRKIWLHLLF